MPQSLSLENQSSQWSSKASDQTVATEESASAAANCNAENGKSISNFKNKLRNKSAGVKGQSAEYVGTNLKDLLSQHKGVVNSYRYKEVYGNFLKYTSSREKQVVRELPQVAQKILDLTNLLAFEYQSRADKGKNTISANKARDVDVLLSFKPMVSAFKEWRDKYKSADSSNSDVLRAEQVQNFFPLLKDFRRQMESVAEPVSMTNWFYGSRKGIFSRHVKYLTNSLLEYMRDQVYLTFKKTHWLHEITIENFVNINYKLHQQFESEYLQLKTAGDATEYHSLLASMAMLKTMQAVDEFETDLRGRQAQRQAAEAAQKRRQMQEEGVRWAAEAARQGELADSARARKQSDDADRTERRHLEAENYLIKKNTLRAELQCAVERQDNERTQTERITKAAAKARRAPGASSVRSAENSGLANTPTPSHARASAPTSAPTSAPASAIAERTSENTTFTSHGTAYPVVNTATGEPAVVLKKDTIYETKNADGTSESYRTSEVLPIRLAYRDKKAIGAEHGPLVPGAYKSTGKRIEFPQTSGLVKASERASTSVTCANRVQPYPVQEASEPYKESPGQSARIDLTGAHAQASYQLPQLLSRAVLHAISAPPQAFDSASAVHMASHATPSSMSSPHTSRVSTASPTLLGSAQKQNAWKARAGAVTSLYFGAPEKSLSLAGTQGDRSFAPTRSTPQELSQAYQASVAPRAAVVSWSSYPLPSVQSKITPTHLTEALRLAEISLRCLALDAETASAGYTPYAQQFLRHLNRTGIQQDIHAYPADPVAQPCGSGESSKRPPTPSEPGTRSKKSRANPDTDPGRAAAGLGRSDSLEVLAQGDNIEQGAPTFFENHPERADVAAALKYAFRKIGEKKLRRANRDDLVHLWVADSLSENRVGIKQKVLEKCPDFKAKEIAEQRLEHAAGLAAFYEENPDTAAYCAETSYLFMAYIQKIAPSLMGNFFVISMEQSEKNAQGKVVPLDPDDEESDAHTFVLYTESDAAKREVAEDYNDDEANNVDSHVEFEDFIAFLWDYKATSLILDPWGLKKVVDVSAATSGRDLRSEVREIVYGAGLKYRRKDNKLLLFSQDNPGIAYPSDADVDSDG